MHAYIIKDNAYRYKKHKYSNYPNIKQFTSVSLMLWKESRFIIKRVHLLPALPMQGHLTLWNVTVEFQVLKFDCSLPHTNDFVTHQILVSLFPAPSGVFSYALYITTYCPHLSFSVTVLFLSLGFMYMSERVKGRRMEINSYGGFCTSWVYKLLILYSGLSC